MNAAPAGGLPGALAGLKVIDLTVMLAGPFCTMLLADQGADVIKVEPPEGDHTRTVGPFMPDDGLHAFGGYFQSVNRNKRSIALDLKSAAGRADFLKLVAGADVVVENFRAGVMDRLGLGYETLAAVNPRLVYACLRGFGDPRTGASPYVDWPAYDVVAQAMGGVMGITGPAPDQPMKVGPGIGDTVPATMLAFGILAAVRHADRTGKGQFVDIAMYDAILALCERIAFQHSYAGVVPHPEGNGHPLLCPFGLFRAADGWVSIACPQDRFWRDLCTAMGRPELGTDPRYALNNDRVVHRTEVIEAVTAWTSTRSKAELGAALGGLVPFGPVNDATDIFADPHVAVREMLQPVDHPGSARRGMIAGVPLRMTLTQGRVRARAPLLDEHADDIRAEFTRAAPSLQKTSNQDQTQ
ncbi:CoA transferase [Tistrella mobilis]